MLELQCNFITYVLVWYNDNCQSYFHLFFLLTRNADRVSQQLLIWFMPDIYC